HYRSVHPTLVLDSLHRRDADEFCSVTMQDARRGWFTCHRSDAAVEVSHLKLGLFGTRRGNIVLAKGYSPWSTRPCERSVPQYPHLMVRTRP
ncbi:hypothetical protein OAH22_03085, partial [bacterium]|nr:hypothetical protein [bacterium]